MIYDMKVDPVDSSVEFSHFIFIPDVFDLVACSQAL